MTTASPPTRDFTLGEKYASVSIALLNSQLRQGYLEHFSETGKLQVDKDDLPLLTEQHSNVLMHMLKTEDENAQSGLKDQLRAYAASLEWANEIMHEARQHARTVASWTEAEAAAQSTTFDAVPMSDQVLMQDMAVSYYKAQPAFQKRVETWVRSLSPTSMSKSERSIFQVIKNRLAAEVEEASKDQGVVARVFEEASKFRQSYHATAESHVRTLLNRLYDEYKGPFYSNSRVKDIDTYLSNRRGILQTLLQSQDDCPVPRLGISLKGLSIGRTEDASSVGLQLPSHHLLENETLSYVKSRTASLRESGVGYAPNFETPGISTAHEAVKKLLELNTNVGNELAVDKDKSAATSKRSSSKKARSSHRKEGAKTQIAQDYKGDIKATLDSILGEVQRVWGALDSEASLNDSTRGVPESEVSLAKARHLASADNAGADYLSLRAKVDRQYPPGQSASSKDVHRYNQILHMDGESAKVYRQLAKDRLLAVTGGTGQDDTTQMVTSSADAKGKGIEIQDYAQYRPVSMDDLFAPSGSRTPGQAPLDSEGAGSSQQIKGSWADWVEEEQSGEGPS